MEHYLRGPDTTGEKQNKQNKTKSQPVTLLLLHIQQDGFNTLTSQ